MYPNLRMLVSILFVLTIAASAGDEKKSKRDMQDRETVTQHKITVKGKTLEYAVKAGTMVLKKEDGTPQAEIFYMAYTLNKSKDMAKRPITFSFNGGPGSSSVWLHLGIFGPRRVLMDENGFPLKPPYELVDNEHTLLTETDLVFIDPVSTGYSRAVDEKKAKNFHGVQEDIQSVAEFIRLYTTREERWSSPKFLVGESYGTTRAAGLSEYLSSRMGMYLNGVMLVSSILDFGTVRFNTDNDLPYVLFLPTYTATAWYHKQLPDDLQQDLRKALDESEAFASGPYLQALFKGNNLSDQERDQVIAKLARLTGLSPEYIDATNLRIHISRFVKELRRDEDLTVGRLDSRFTGRDRDSSRERYEFDPSYSAIQGPYTATLNAYVREELGFESDLSYEILTGRVQPWNYKPYQNRYIDMGEDLRSAMNRNPHMKVFVANGYYDLATPYFATEYTFSHMPLDDSLRKQITMGYYESGHMMYIHIPSLIKLNDDLAAFIKSAL